MFQENYHKYTFVYLNNNTFYIIKFNSNLINLVDPIKNIILNKYNDNTRIDIGISGNIRQ